MSVSEHELTAEAERAWAAEGRRREEPTGGELTVAMGASAVGALAATLVGGRLAASLQGGGAWLLGVVTVGLALGQLMLPAQLLRRARKRARARIERAQNRRRATGCPRCAAPVLARDRADSGSRTCGRCGAHLLEARGLLICEIRDAEWRTKRWRAAARARLGARPSARAWLGGSWLGAAPAIGVALLALLGVFMVGDALASSRAPIATHVPLLFDAEAPAAHAAQSFPVAAPTRAPARVVVGARVLTGDGAELVLGVVVRARETNADVVTAEGELRRVERGALLEAELRRGDVVEVRERPSEPWVEARVRARVGDALRVRRDEVDFWVGPPAYRVRADAPRGGSLGPAPARGARVEVMVEGQLVPARVTGSYVTLESGQALDASGLELTPGHPMPGARVWVDGLEGQQLVASRLEHAIVVVGPDGVRRWTALSRVRRDAP